MTNDYEKNLRFARFCLTLQKNIPGKTTMSINLEKGEGDKAGILMILYFGLYPKRTFPQGNTCYPISLMIDHYTFKSECKRAHSTFLELEKELENRINKTLKEL